MVFFQVVLLGGYAYSDWVTRRLASRAQVRLHIGLEDADDLIDDLTQAFARIRRVGSGGGT